MLFNFCVPFILNADDVRINSRNLVEISSRKNKIVKSSFRLRFSKIELLSTFIFQLILR